MYMYIHINLESLSEARSVLKQTKERGREIKGGGEDLRLFVHSRAPHAGRFSGFVMEI